MTEYDGDSAGPGPLMSVRAAAEYLDVSQQKIRQLLKYRAFTRVDLAGSVRIPQCEIHEAAVNGITIPPREATETDLELRRFTAETSAMRSKMAARLANFGAVRAANLADPHTQPDPEEDPE
jgi:hypothetical protein